jgi:SAM-dependent methyltransferase
MSNWQERITHETAPSIKAEHELRYRAAAPLILAGGPWGDLGCGNGLAAATALGDARPAHAVLVDIEEEAVARAARELQIAETVELAADLTDAENLGRIEDALLSFGGEPVVTCFEVVEHLRSFGALLEWSNRLAREHRATFVISVPNDAFWSIQNPHHRTSWSEGAFEELRQLLPAEHTLLRQVALSGSALVGWDAAVVPHDLTVSAGGPGTVATHFIAAFGPRHGELCPAAMAVQTDMVEQRRWERQRESDAAVAQQVASDQRAAVRAQDVTIADQREQLQQKTEQFDEWRRYIHELERDLGRPLSGEPREEPSGTPPAATPAATPTSVDVTDPPA